MSGSPARRRETMSDQALIEGTGADWKTWLAILDERDATSLKHAAIAGLVAKEYGVDGWWAQSIAVGYEQERGMREPGQRSDGTYEASASKTLPVDAASAFEWVADPDRRRIWLDDLELSQRTASPPKSVRFDSSDGRRAQFTFEPRAERKTAVAVQVGKLASAEEAANVKAAWKARLARLAAAIPR
ncbi:hypothetical protein [Glycomyces xiaoerkulensis]|uniref:hypothetical protein n=1 Tax=Glycomyces xiaoerkulensis TaxID=2038139 RepID=UPI000C26A8A4|nr:hypothetical protein [Glycomyces xiaoerkulensis]